MKRIRLFTFLVILALLAGNIPIPAAAQPLGNPSERALLKQAVEIHTKQSAQAGMLTAELLVEGEALKLSPAAAISVAFNQRMDPESARPALLLYPYAAGELSWDEGFTRLTFTPNPPLKGGQRYLVFLDSELRSAAGEVFNQVQEWEIQVRYGPQIAGEPKIIAKNTRLPAFQLAFTEAMETASTNAALSMQPPLAYTLEWAANKKQLTLQPSEPLTPGVVYTFVMTTGAQSVDGAPLQEEYSWHHSLPAFEAQISPPSTKDPYELQVTFSYPLDFSMETLPLEISPAVPGAWAGDLSDRRVVRFNNPEGFRPGTWYTLQVKAALRDANGYQLPTPAPQRFYVSPPILGAYPFADSFDECLEISIGFERPVDQARTAAAFSLSPALPGELSWEGNRLIFRPEPFSGEKVVTAQLGTGSVDAEGKRILAEPYRWSFTCYNYAASYRWDWQAAFSDMGDPIQTLEADGRRAIQFRVRSDEAKQPVRVDFALYSLSRELFIQRYVAGQENWFANLPAEPLETWRMPGLGDGIHESFIPNLVEPGIYILRMVSAGGSDSRIHMPDHLFIILTHNALLAKRGVGDVWVWASAINGTALAEAQVRVYAARGEMISQGKTDRDGLYRAQINPAYQPTLVILAGENGDISVTGLDSHWNASQCWYCWRGSTVQEPVKVYAYSERPLYKPGQTVLFKIIVRQDDDARYSLPPEGSPVQVRVRDGRNNIVQVIELKTNNFGTASGEFVLAETAGLGDYALQVEALGSLQYAGNFTVQDYRKPDFELAITPEQVEGRTMGDENTPYVAGETARLQVSASYFFGAPLASADLQVRLYEIFENYDYYYYFNSPNSRPAKRQAYAWSDFTLSDFTARLNADGTAWIEVPIPEDYYYSDTSWGNSRQEKRWGVEVTAIANGQEVSAYHILTTIKADQEVRLERSGWFKAVGQPFELLAQVTDRFGAPVAGKVLSLEAARWSATSYSYDRVLFSTEATSDNQGTARFRLTPPEVGYYQLTVQGEDTAGREILAHSGFYAAAENVAGYESYQQPLKIYAGQDSYQPYRPAVFLIESQFSGPALLSIERGRVSRAIPVTLNAPLTEVEVPLIWSDAPNIFVTISAFEAQDTTLASYLARLGEQTWGVYNLSDSKLQQATVEVQVDASERRLTVDLQADRERYQPRQQATFNLQVSDNRGKGVEAEVSLALVDEAIFSLASDPNPSIFEAFYARRPHTVNTYHSFAPWRWLYDEGGRGGGGGDGGLTSPRRDFPDTALWLPAVRTDKNGKASVQVTLPDNLTRWRLTARAISADTRVGEAQINIVTDQEVTLQPATPRGLTRGDQAALAVVVTNYSAQARSLQVSLAAEGLSVTSPLTQTVELAAGAQANLTWDSLAETEGTAQLTFRAQDAAGNGDAVQLPLPVLPRAARQDDVQTGSFEKIFSRLVVMPTSALPASRVTLRLSPSLSGDLLAGMEYLVGYPYGCVEQTMSRALPNVVVGRAQRQLRLQNLTLETDLPALVNAGLQKLYGMQHNDGGWGWWYDDNTDAYQTAWVTFGLALTAQAGYPVDPGAVQRGAEWLKTNEMDARTRAFALYAMALAGYGDLGQTQELAGQAQELDAFSHAALALALAQLGQSEAALESLDQLAGRAVQNGGWTYWPNSALDGEYHQKTMASTTRSTALALSAFASLRPKDARLAGIVRYLMSQRRGNGWGSTNETAFTLLALTDYLAASASPAEARQLRVTLDGAELFNGRLEAQSPSLELVLGAAQIPSGGSLLEVSQSGNSPLYYTLTSQVYYGQDEIPPAGPVRVERRYLDARSGQPIAVVQSDQLVRVELKVSLAQAGSFFIVEDHLPGGLEALNEALNNASHQGREVCWGCQETFGWSDLGYNNKEIRGERVTFFVTNLEQGTHTFTYLARALHSGAFSALPAEAYAMYDGEQWGRSASGRLEVAGP